MNLINVSKNKPIEPEIELDGGYAYCVRCLNELEQDQNIYPKCGQEQDWSWLHNKKTIRRK